MGIRIGECAQQRQQHRQKQETSGKLKDECGWNIGGGGSGSARKRGCRGGGFGGVFWGEEGTGLTYKSQYKVWILFYFDQPQSQSCFYLRAFALAISSKCNFLQSSLPHLCQAFCSKVTYSVSVKPFLDSLFKIVTPRTHTHFLSLIFSSQHLPYLRIYSTYFMTRGVIECMALSKNVFSE